MLSNDACRACLTQSNDMRPLWALVPYTTCVSLMDLINKLTSVKVAPEDGLPQNVCTSCERDLIYLHEFAVKVENTDLALRQNVFELRPPCSPENVKSEPFDTVGGFGAGEFNLMCDLPALGFTPTTERACSIPAEVADHLSLAEFDSAQSSSQLFNLLSGTDHTNISKPECMHCHRVFNMDADLQTHLLSHTEERPHKCLTCGMQFKLRHHLKRHSKIHLKDSSNRQSPSSPKIYLTSAKNMCEEGFEDNECYLLSSNLPPLNPLNTDEAECPPIVVASSEKNMCEEVGFEDSVCYLSSDLPPVNTLNTEQTESSPIVVSSSEASRAETEIHPLAEFPSAHAAPLIMDAVPPPMNKNIPKINCRYCYEVFDTEADLQFHSVSHFGERPHECTTCGVRFKLRHHLTRHVKMHLKPKVVKSARKKSRQSKIREKEFKDREHSTPSSKLLKTALRKDKARTLATDSKHSQREDSWLAEFNFDRPVHPLFETLEPNRPTSKCKYCHKEFKIDADLHSHMISHSEERPHKCLTCGVRFKRRHHLTRHAKVHCKGDANPLPKPAPAKPTKISVTSAKSKSYKCDFCTKAFDTQRKRQEHRRWVHTKQRLFDCKLCDMTFKRQRDLNTHMKRHANEKTFTCETCDKVFLTSRALSMHTETACSNITDMQPNGLELGQVYNEALYESVKCELMTAVSNESFAENAISFHRDRYAETYHRQDSLRDQCSRTQEQHDVPVKFEVSD